MGLFSKIFGSATEEGADLSSKEAAAPEHAADAAASAAAPEGPPVTPTGAAVELSPAKAPSPRKEPERSLDGGASAPATRRGIAKTEGLFAPPGDAEPRVVVGAVAAEPLRTAAASDESNSLRNQAAPRTASAEPARSRQVPSRSVEVHAAPIKVAGGAPAPNGAKPGPAAGTGSSRTATRHDSSRPVARAARATPPKPAAAVRAAKAAKQPGRGDAPQNAEQPPPLAQTPASTEAIDGAKAVTLDLDSLPPPAPPETETPAPPRGQMESQDDVDRAFALVESSEAARSHAPGTHVVDPMVKEHNAELFRQMAIGFARPVRDFMLDLVLGPTTKHWLDIAKAPVQNLLKGAVEFELTELEAALVDFDRGISNARNTLGAVVAGAERERLLARYQALARALPQAFDLTGERSRREPMVVHHLLLQVRGVHQLAIDKLYAAGLASLEGLGRSSVEDLMAHARLERDGAEGIVRRFRSYLRERTEHVLERGEVHVKQRLLDLIAGLGQAHQEFLRADADEDRVAKRRARVERRARALEMNVLLAQLGELELIADLERSGTDRRIERMRSYVESSGRAQPSRQEAV
jgi:hypothetical protein